MFKSMEKTAEKKNLDLDQSVPDACAGANPSSAQAISPKSERCDENSDSGSTALSPLLLFACACIVLILGLLIHDPQGSISDDLQVTTILDSLTTRGEWNLPQSLNPVGINEAKGADGKIYGAMNVGPVLYGLPFYKLGQIVENITPLAPELVPRSGGWGPVFARLSYALLLPLLFLLYYRSGRVFGWSATHRLLFASAATFGTQILAVNHSNYNHNLSALGLALAYCFTVENYARPSVRYGALAGLGLMIALITRQASGLYLPIFALFAFWSSWKSRRWSPLIVMGLVAVLGLGINLWYNHIRFDSVVAAGYDRKWLVFIAPWKGYFRHLFLLDESIPLNAPVLLVSLFALPLMPRRHFGVMLAATVAVTHFTFYSAWMYKGGIYGLRFQSEVLFLMLIPAGFLLHVRKWQVEMLLLTVYGTVNNALRSLWDLRLQAPPPPVNHAPLAVHHPIIEFKDRLWQDYALAPTLEWAWVHGCPPWAASLLLGPYALQISFAGFGILALAAALAGARYKNSGVLAFAFCTLLAAVILGIGALFSFSLPRTAAGLDDGPVTLRDVGVSWHRGAIHLTGEINVSDPSIPVAQYGLLLRRKSPLREEFRLNGRFYFGAPYLHSAVMKPDVFYNFRHNHSISPYFPPGRYEVLLLVYPGRKEVPLSDLSIDRKPPRIAHPRSISVAEFPGINPPPKGTQDIVQVGPGGSVSVSYTAPEYPAHQLLVGVVGVVSAAMDSVAFGSIIVSTDTGERNEVQLTSPVLVKALPVGQRAGIQTLQIQYVPPPGTRHEFHLARIELTFP